MFFEKKRRLTKVLGPLHENVTPALFHTLSFFCHRIFAGVHYSCNYRLLAPARTNVCFGARERECAVHTPLSPSPAGTLEINFCRFLV
jgi:hypothetical protein